MAVLQNIRNRAGLLIGIIAFALLAFLVGDLLQNGTFGSPDRTIAEINGEEIDIEEYHARLNELTEIYKLNSGQVALDTETSERVQDETWNTMVRDYIMNEEYENVGITVSGDEIFELVQGNNIHPMIRQMFADPQTGMVNKAQILSYLKSFEMEGGEERKAYWLFIEKELKKQRLNEKYNNLLIKGIGVNSAEVNYAIEAAKTVKDVDFFAVSYSTIPDSSIQVSDSEISAYYKKNKENYKQNESRSIEYVTYDIVASTDDEMEVSKWSENIAKEFKDVVGDAEIARYVKFNSDDDFNNKYLAKADVEDQLTNFAFEGKVGDIYGPYKEGDTYKIIKLANREMRADSVKASHILIQEASIERTNELADSLFAILEESPSKMSSLAKAFSKDPGSANEGGDLGWFNDGVMVPEFNTAAFEGKVGQVQKIKTQFGIHLIIVNQKSSAVEKVQLATIIRKIEPSNVTYRNIYTEASKFRSASSDYKSFKASAQEAGKRVRLGSNIARDSKTIMGLPKSSELVRWAYNAKSGDVSDVMEMEGTFIVATLTKVSDKGYRPQNVVEPIILNEIRQDKKAEIIIADINSKKADSQTITSLASKMNADIKTAAGVAFDAYSVPAAGVEPMLVGAIATAQKDAISAPIAGNRAVYVFKVVNESPNANINNFASEKASMEQSKAYMINYQAFNTLLEDADVKDMRLKF